MWQWLELHNATLQTASSLVGTIIGIATIVVLVLTWSAAHHAARAAEQQAAAANALTKVSKAQQVATERAAAAAEAQVVAAEASAALARQQLQAAEESAAVERAQSELVRQQTLASLTPILSFNRRNNATTGWTVLENESTALALDVFACNGTPDNPGSPLGLSHGTFAAGVESRIEGINWGYATPDKAGQWTQNRSVPVFARYRSADGRWFLTTVDLAVTKRHQETHEEPAAAASHSAQSAANKKP